MFQRLLNHCNISYLENLNKTSDDYFKEPLAARERNNTILNNFNTQTEYSSPLSEQNVNNHNKETLIIIICMIFMIVINQILMMTIFYLYHRGAQPRSKR